MSRKVIKYDVITARNEKAFIQLVNEFIKFGYELHGGLTIAVDDSNEVNYAQAVVMYEEAPKPKLSGALYEILSNYLKKEYIEDWASKPNPAFDNKTPIEIWNNPSTRYRLEQMVAEIDAGVAN